MQRSADLGIRRPDAPPEALRDLCQLASAQAARWGTAARQSSPVPSRRKRLLKLALVGSSGLLALVVVAAQFRGEPPPADAPLAVAALPLQATPLPSPIAADVIEPVRWEGSELVIDLGQVPLPDAVQSLAQATRTTVSGVELLRQQPVLVTLRLRGRDVATAWQHLLHRRARYSITCNASDCHVWITGATSAPQAVAAPDAEATPPAAGETGPASEEADSQPGGSC